MQREARKERKGEFGGIGIASRMEREREKWREHKHELYRTLISRTASLSKTAVYRGQDV